MVKVGEYYKFVKGNSFKVTELKNGLYRCEATHRYDIFFIVKKDLEQKIFDNEIVKI